MHENKKQTFSISFSEKKVLEQTEKKLFLFLNQTAKRMHIVLKNGGFLTKEI
jgi:hypothetical protein